MSVDYRYVLAVKQLKPRNYWFLGAKVGILIFFVNNAVFILLNYGILWGWSVSLAILFMAVIVFVRASYDVARIVEREDKQVV